MTYLFTRSIILVFRQSFAVFATNTCLVAETMPTIVRKYVAKQKGIESHANHN